MKSELAEIKDACLNGPREFYEEFGLFGAIVFTLTMPITIPIAAIFYFSIEEQKRALLDESEE